MEQRSAPRGAATLLGVVLALGVPLALITACGPPPPKGEVTGPGTDVSLPAPQGGAPTVNFSHIIGWQPGEAPTAPAGFAVTRYAQGLDHPRWITVLPNGDVLVAESATPPGKVGSPLDWLKNRWMKRSGEQGASANRITLLRDKDGDGKVDEKSVFLSGLNQPFGMALLNGYFYVGNTDGVVRYPYTQGATHLEGAGEKILPLPAGGYNNHWTRNLLVRADGAKIYVSVGSSSNVGENGLKLEERRANILEINPDGTAERILASGLRNPNGMDFEPTTGALWTAVNERDFLGDNLVPDYLTHIEDGGFYGWPFSYWGGNIDKRIAAKDQRADLVAKALVPDYALGAHVAALGLAFYSGSAFPDAYRGGAFVGEHGSWNRSVFSGYKVVFVPFKDAHPSGPPQDFLTGFMADAKSGAAHGRPVGVALDKTGALLVADDAGNMVWRIAPAR
jgi:glucose/arabinose dehydrogenase